MRASRLGRSVANAPTVAFGRAGDLYHAKADWPNQDTQYALKVARSLGLIKTRVTITGGKFSVALLPAAHAGLITLAVNDSQ